MRQRQQEFILDQLGQPQRLIADPQRLVPLRETPLLGRSSSFVMEEVGRRPPDVISKGLVRAARQFLF